MKSKIVADEMYKGHKCIVRYIYPEDEMINMYPANMRDEMRNMYRWFGGYVSIPELSKLYGMDVDDVYDENHIASNLDVHGGITFTGKVKNLDKSYEGNEFFIGFDCNHYGDNPNVQNEEFALLECKKLVNQIIDLDK